MPFNKLTLAEAERLACLAEELGEAVQVIGKILRHGYESYNPRIGPLPTNRDMLEKELGDVRYWITEMCAEGDLSNEDIVDATRNKTTAVQPYLHHQNPRRR